jgi:putative ABC transport system permease protein
MSHIGQAIRQLERRPGLSLVVILMLAVGIGATTAMFSLFHQMLVRPLPVPEPDRLVNIVRANSGQGFSYPMLRDLEAEQGVLSGIAAHWPFAANVAYGVGAVSLPATYVSGGYFAVLNLRPALGRLIGPQDEPAAGESAVVVLGYGLWQSRFGGDPSILGRTLAIDGEALTVIGVAPKGFSGTRLGRRSRLFVPLTMRWRFEPLSGPASPDSRNFTWLRLFGRLKAGVSLEQAAAGVNAVHGRIVREVEAPLRGISEEALPQFLREPLQLLPGGRGQGSVPGAAESLTLLLGVTVLVLLIVCVNVANLLLVRGAARAGEMAIRESMGASRGQLVAQLFAEAALPTAIGGVLALPLAGIALTAVTPILPAGIADGFALKIGWRAASFAALVTGASAIAVGVLPALRTARAGAAPALRAYVAQAIGGRGATRLRSALTAAQLAFSMVLLVLAGLFARSLLNVAHIDLGIDVDSLASFSASPRLNGYDDERTAAVYNDIERALAAQPGVVGVTSAAVPVLAGSDFELDDLTVEGFGNGNGGQPVSSSFNIIGPGFFETLGIPLLAGREFAVTDTDDSPPVAIVNERFARRYGLAGGALGKQLGAGPDRYEIVGVVANASYDQVKGEGPAQFFVPLKGNHSLAVPRSLTFYVRASLDPDALLTAIPRAVASVDTTLPVGNVITLRRQAQENVFADRLVSILSAGFAGLATLLAAIGLYGVMAYNTAQRTRELGLRLALGARPGNLRFMVLKQAGWMAFIGIVIGLVAAVGSGRAAEALLYGLSSRDPAVLGASAAVLVAVVLAASYWPARRASRIDPMEALRYE